MTFPDLGYAQCARTTATLKVALLDGTAVKFRSSTMLPEVRYSPLISGRIDSSRSMVMRHYVINLPHVVEVGCGMISYVGRQQTVA